MTSSGSFPPASPSAPNHRDAAPHEFQAITLARLMLVYRRLMCISDNRLSKTLLLYTGTGTDTGVRGVYQDNRDLGP